MISLIRWAFGRWLRQQKNAVNGALERQKRLDTTAKMGNDDMIGADSVVGQLNKLAFGGEGHHANPVPMSEARNSFEINERRDGARDAGDTTRDARDVLDDRLRYGFVGHDGLPWFYEPTKKCWLPVTETRYASAYAALQKQISVE